MFERGLTFELVYDEVEIERVLLVDVDDLVGRSSERGSRGRPRRSSRQTSSRARPAVQRGRHRHGGGPVRMRGQEVHRIVFGKAHRA